MNTAAEQNIWTGERAEPLTVAELVQRLANLSPEAPIYGYLGNDGFWFQAEPVGENIATILRCATSVTTGGIGR